RKVNAKPKRTPLLGRGAGRGSCFRDVEGAFDAQGAQVPVAVLPGAGRGLAGLAGVVAAAAAAVAMAAAVERGLLAGLDGGAASRQMQSGTIHKNASFGFAKSRRARGAAARVKLS